MSTSGESKNRQIIQSLTAPVKSSKANDSGSIPLELLTEFLFSVMKKDYEKALNYCIQILNFEPHNSTIRKFYPLIVEEMSMKELECSSSESSESSSSNSSDEGDENFKTKTSQQSGRNCKSSKYEYIDEIEDCFSSNLKTPEIKSKNQKCNGDDQRKIVSQPLKEKNYKINK